MAKKKNQYAERLKFWRWFVDFANSMPDGQRFIFRRSEKALSKAEEFFGLSRSNEYQSRVLMAALADVVFGPARKRGRPRGTKKWGYKRVVWLAIHRDEIEKEGPKVRDNKAAQIIKDLYPDFYKNATVETIRQRLVEARRISPRQKRHAQEIALEKRGVRITPVE